MARIWNSPTLMTWGGFLVRVGSFFALLPLVLNRLSAAEIVVWYLFSTLIAMQWLLDMGFGSTMSRAISYSMAGATSVRGFKTVNEHCGNGTPNWELTRKIITSMKVIYVLLAVVVFFVIGFTGTWALAKPISEVSASANAWLAWALILVIYPLRMWANVYSYYLEGTNRIALVRRWDILYGLGGTGTGALVLVLGGGLLGLVAVNQAWSLARIFRDRTICHRVDDGRFKSFDNKIFHKDIFDALWPSAWRSGLGGFMAYGFIYCSSLIVAQVGETKEVASYLLSMRLIDSVAQFSMAPFYTKLPQLARKRAEGDIDGLVKIAKRSMSFAYWAFVLGFLFVAFFAAYLLESIRSNASFVQPDMWALMGFSYFIHRYGAMHVQLYSTTNHITSHIADGVSGIMFIGVSVVLFQYIGLYALPIGLISGYLGFYAWFSACQSYRAINTGFFTFERYVLFPPMIILLIYVSAIIAPKLHQ